MESFLNFSGYLWAHNKARQLDIRVDVIGFSATSTIKIKKRAPTDSAASQVRKSIHPAKPRATLQPGTVLILLAGRFRGKRVILLKHLPQGVLLITGPFKVNGVPLRRVNARYVIATSAKVELKGIDEKVVGKVGGEGYFTREKKGEKSGEEAFFKQGEKPEVRDPRSKCWK